MLKIDDDFLEGVGLGELSAQEKDQLKLQIYESLEGRVGMRLAAQMSDSQLKEFEKFVDSEDEAGALQWLETNFPDYPKVVKAELEKLQVELKADAAKIKEHLERS